MKCSGIHSRGSVRGGGCRKRWELSQPRCMQTSGLSRSQGMRPRKPQTRRLLMEEGVHVTGAGITRGQEGKHTPLPEAFNGVTGYADRS